MRWTRMSPRKAEQPLITCWQLYDLTWTISVIGAVNAPGVHQLQGHKTLFEVLSMSGGLRTDAGSMINITRNLHWGTIPLPDRVTPGIRPETLGKGRVSQKLILILI